MKPCRSFAADLDLLAAGILPLEQNSPVKGHLAGCAACRERYADALALCAELSAVGQGNEPPDAAVWRLRNRVRTAVTAPVSDAGKPWQAAAALAAGVACVVLCVHRAAPPVGAPGPAELSAAAPPATDPPLTLLACERAAARSDAALDQTLSRDAARPHAVSNEQPLRAFSPTVLAALDHNGQLP